MKRFVLLAALLLAAPAAAQPPREVIATERIELRIGQTRTFEFDKPYSGFSIASDAVAKINVLTDQTFTILGIGPGETLITINFKDDDIHRMSVVVGGRTVRIYGTGKDEKDYVGYFCTATDCGRGDSDAPQPSGVTVEKRSRGRDGSINTITKQY